MPSGGVDRGSRAIFIGDSADGGPAAFGFNRGGIDGLGSSIEPGAAGFGAEGAVCVLRGRSLDGGGLAVGQRHGFGRGDGAGLFVAFAIGGTRSGAAILVSPGRVGLAFAVLLRGLGIERFGLAVAIAVLASAIPIGAQLPSPSQPREQSAQGKTERCIQYPVHVGEVGGSYLTKETHILKIAEGAQRKYSTYPEQTGLRPTGNDGERYQAHVGQTEIGKGGQAEGDQHAG